ncbi:MAG TPA: C1 family peptidase [Thermoanaerobaculia bacterium]|nr:C1 family peptidase [Thermoanaerobaculia bacterium]
MASKKSTTRRAARPAAKPKPKVKSAPFQPAAGRGERKPAALRLGTGWLPEPPDRRDFTASHAPLAGMLARLGVGRMLRKKRLPARIDLRQWAGPVQFQGGFNTCGAHVVAGLVTYFEKKAHGLDVAPSRLFLYKVAKNFLQTEGDAGVYIRQVMGVLKLIGVPPERYWPYPDPGTFTQPRMSDPLLAAEPTAFCYAVANDYRAITYYRLDESEQQPAELLHLAKAHLAAQVPFAFGFPLYHSVLDAKTSGRIPYPEPPQPSLANHAVVALGYDDSLEIGGSDGAAKTRGALLIKNSWSDGWGEQGFGWLPYDFVLQGHTRDFWTLLRSEWIDTGAFELGP